MSSKADLEAALRSSADAATPIPDRSFVDGLELRLLADDGKVVPFARRARRISVVAAAAIAFTIAGVAAAAGIVVTQPFSNKPAVPAEATLPTASTDAAIDTTTATSTTLTSPATAIPGEVTVVPTAPVTVSATVPAATVPTATEPPATQPPATVPATTFATSTTEVHNAATLTIECATNGTSVTCNWSGAVPEGAATYAVLRGEAGSAGPGRVYFVPLGTTSWVDSTPTLGASYSYLVHGFDANNQSLAHSNGTLITCC